MIRAGLGLAGTGWLLYQWGATQIGGWTLVTGLALVALAFKLRTWVRYKTVTVKTEGGHGPRYTAEHEIGHRKTAQHYGVPVGETWIAKDGSGNTKVYIPRDADPNLAGAIADGGRQAEGVGRDHYGCRSDQRTVRAAIRRGGDRKTIERMAADALRGGLGRDVDRLMNRGRL